MEYHKPVMVSEILEHLQVNKGKKYLDLTLGDGGHTLEILRKGASVLALDYNLESIKRARERIQKEGLMQECVLVHANFKDIEEVAKEYAFSQVNGILYDLGFSSSQLEKDESGLTFLADEPLDMRLDNLAGVSAADLVNALSEKELATLIFEYSGERNAKKFAKAIVKARTLKKIQTTKQLAQILVDETSPGYERGRINPATRTFQALRIAVNDELTNLEQSLPRAARLLLPGAKLVVITFHSLEDKIAKSFGLGAQPYIREVTRKPIVPSAKELQTNVRARSAKMRVFEKI